jgi:hypothetical protein
MKTKVITIIIMFNKIITDQNIYQLLLQSTACFLTNLFLSSNAVVNSLKILDLNGNNTSNGT